MKLKVGVGEKLKCNIRTTQQHTTKKVCVQIWTKSVQCTRKFISESFTVYLVISALHLYVMVQHDTNSNWVPSRVCTVKIFLLSAPQECIQNLLIIVAIASVCLVNLVRRVKQTHARSIALALGQNASTLSNLDCPLLADFVSLHWLLF